MHIRLKAVTFRRKYSDSAEDVRRAAQAGGCMCVRGARAGGNTADCDRASCDCGPAADDETSCRAAGGRECPFANGKDVIVWFGLVATLFTCEKGWASRVCIRHFVIILMF